MGTWDLSRALRFQTRLEAERRRGQNRFMTFDWDTRIERFWREADDTVPERMLATMRGLMEERPTEDPDALYEWASVHDFLGMEAQAIPLYESALRAGLSGNRRPQAVIQLSSSLRNVGRAEEAVRLLNAETSGGVTGDAAAAFLALALHSSGRPNEALSIALRALARTLPMYGNAVTRYADELGGDSSPS